MPIKTENRSRYPRDWKRISKEVRFVRAGNKCEFCGCDNHKPHPITGSKVVLTVAHLDHCPENCADENLKALCQKCHNSYDAAHRAETRKNATARLNPMNIPQLKLFSNGEETAVRSAILSDCGQYRYELRRTWDESLPKAMFLMLNPSTADADIDDPTIRRCLAFAKSWGYGGILVGNLFAYRATDPKALLTAADPIGRENEAHLKAMQNESSAVICAWGNGRLVEKLSKKYCEDYKPLSKFAGRLFYLELANDGTPKHPLYLKGDLKPVLFDAYNALIYNFNKKTQLTQDETI